MSFQTPAAFKAALEHRLKERAHQRGLPLQRCRQLAIFERFLARVYEATPTAFVLKGGFVMELRFAAARTTKDVDARATGDLDMILAKLRSTIMVPSEDFLTFDCQFDENMSEIVGEQIVYSGRRLRLQAQLAGKQYGDPFGFDIAVGDAMVLPFDELTGDDLFEFMGQEPLIHRVYPPETHVAEKLHALTFPRPADRPNSRVKDLVDVVLLATACPFVAETLRRSVEATFEFRNTHDIPLTLPQSPADWETRYAKLRQDDDLPWPGVVDLFDVATSFANPVLDNTATGQWDPSSAIWHG